MSDESDATGIDIAGTEDNLTLGAQVNWPFLLASGILRFLDAGSKPYEYYEPEQVKRTALSVLSTIPVSDRDDEFQADYEKAQIIRYEDLREEWCTHRMGKKTPQNQRKWIDYDPQLLMTAIMGLLKRLGLLSKIISVEKRMNRKQQEALPSGIREATSHRE